MYLTSKYVSVNKNTSSFQIKYSKKIKNPIPLILQELHP